MSKPDYVSRVPSNSCSAACTRAYHGKPAAKTWHWFLLTPARKLYSAACDLARGRSRCALNSAAVASCARASRSARLCTFWFPGRSPGTRQTASGRTWRCCCTGMASQHGRRESMPLVPSGPSAGSGQRPAGSKQSRVGSVRTPGTGQRGCPIAARETCTMRHLCKTQTETRHVGHPVPTQLHTRRHVGGCLRRQRRCGFADTRHVSVSWTQVCAGHR